MAHIFQTELFNLVPAYWREGDISAAAKRGDAKGYLQIFFEALDATLEDWSTAIPTAIRNAFDVEKASASQLRLLAYMMGFKLPTVTVPYLRRFLVNCSIFRAWKGNYDLIPSAIFLTTGLHSEVEVPWRDNTCFTVGVSEVCSRTPTPFVSSGQWIDIDGDTYNLPDHTYNTLEQLIYLLYFLFGDGDGVFTIELVDGLVRVKNNEDFEFYDPEAAPSTVVVSMTADLAAALGLPTSFVLDTPLGYYDGQPGSDPIGLDYTEEAYNTFSVGSSMVGTGAVGSTERNPEIPFTFYVHLLFEPTVDQLTTIRWIVSHLKRAVDLVEIVWPAETVYWIVGFSRVGIDTLVADGAFMVGVSAVGSAYVRGPSATLLLTKLPDGTFV